MGIANRDDHEICDSEKWCLLLPDRRGAEEMALDIPDKVNAQSLLPSDDVVGTLLKLLASEHLDFLSLKKHVSTSLYPFQMRMY